jgi:DNA (cytosine-5)-methyltransferase 1
MRRAAEFFAGIGLVRIALEQAGWEVVFANDIAPEKHSMYRDNFSSDNDFRLGDIRDIKASDIPTVSLATASFPCIDLSLAGNRNGLNGKHSSAFWEFHRIIREMKAKKPLVVLLENVVGLLSSKRGEDLKSILSSLCHLGYVCDVLAVDAAHFVPQSRQRLFIIASLMPFNAAGKDLQPHQARPKRLVEFIEANKGLMWNHILLPPLPARKSNLPDVVERLRAESSAWWDGKRKAHLYSQMSIKHKALLRQLVESRVIRFATVYKRVRPSGCRAEIRVDGVAGCLRTPRGGSSKQFLVQAGRGTWKVRNLTAREYARLQGVTDSYNINVPYSQALLGFGDAVCVPAFRWIVEYCINPYVYVPPSK